MKTTFLVRDELYELLSEEAKKMHGGARKMSLMLNEILASHFARKKDLFGSSKRFSLSGLRDESDRFG